MTLTLEKPTCIVFDGPFSDCDSEGEECGCWTVSFCDDDQNDIGEVLSFHSYAEAESEFRFQCRKFPKLEGIKEAMRD